MAYGVGGRFSGSFDLEMPPPPLCIIRRVRRDGADQQNHTENRKLVLSAFNLHDPPLVAFDYQSGQLPAPYAAGVQADDVGGLVEAE